MGALTAALLPPGYAPGTPFKMSCSPNTGTVPPFSSSPNPYPAAVYPVRSTYPQQNPYAQVRALRPSQSCVQVQQLCSSVLQALIPSQQQGTYYTQPLYAAPPHVIHHTTVVQPNGMPAAMYAPHLPPSRHSGVAMGMVAGTTMAMSAGEHRWLLCLTVFPSQLSSEQRVLSSCSLSPQELC